MRLPAQDLKQNEDRKRRRRTVPALNGKLIVGEAEEDAYDAAMTRQEKVANFPHHKRVADYLLGRSVGEGSFAKVRLGLHVQTAEEVAVKVISKARARKDAYVHKNLRREGRILQLSRHKNIVQVYDILETDNNYYLVTEFCRGGELIDIVTDKGYLPENDVRRYISQLVSAVSHLHDQGIVHRFEFTDLWFSFYGRRFMFVAYIYRTVKSCCCAVDEIVSQVMSRFIQARQMKLVISSSVYFNDVPRTRGRFGETMQNSYCCSCGNQSWELSEKVICQQDIWLQNASRQSQE